MTGWPEASGKPAEYEQAALTQRLSATSAWHRGHRKSEVKSFMLLVAAKSPGL
jgi:hypothetical protein